jgi:PAS domain S-box-containing protein
MESRHVPRDHAHLAAIVESSDDAIISKDLAGTIRSFNSAAERLFGYTAKEVVGKPVTLLIPPDRQQEEADILARLRRGERIDHFETVRVAKDGTRVEILLTVSPIRDAAGKIVGASKVARDITERNRMTRALAAQEAWFRVTIASIGDGVLAADPQGRVTFMNSTAEQLTGWTAKEAAGRPLAEVFRIVNEVTREPVDNPAQKVLETGAIVGLANHTVLISRGGIERPIADSAAPIRDESKRMIGVVLAFRDATAQRRAEQALAEQREWFETTLRSIGDGVIAVDVHGTVAFMNPVAEHLTGWKFEEARGRLCSDIFKIVNDSSRRVVESPVDRVLSEGIVVGLANHTILVAADGTERLIDDSGAPIRARDGRIIGVVLVFRDVTERRRADNERQAAAFEREDLLERERAARAEAERANRTKDEFVAMVSHELRTPLNAILGWTEVLSRSHPNTETLERGLAVIGRNTRAQAQLISDLLDISRIVSGQLRLEVESIDLAELVKTSLESLEQSAVGKGVEIRQRVSSEPMHTVGDPARLQQVLSNLLSNAIKFTPGGGYVEIAAKRVNSTVEIIISDSGIGIQRQHLKGIFDRFRQSSSATTRRYGGLGLGLSIAKHLVEVHGGTISASSEGPGTGATFTVTLPLRAESAVDAPRTRKDSGAEDLAAQLDLAGIQILVVEDQPDTRELIRHMLESHGAKVSEAATATEALDLVEHDRPNMLVSDIGLPDIDGYELVSRIRRRKDALASMPAIALTAFARPEDRTRALRAGYQAHIAKPVEPDELLVTVASFRGFVPPDSRA